MASKTVLTRFDAADYLETPEDIANFLNDAFESGAPEEVVHALSVVSRAKGMAAIAKTAGLGRESLYKSLKEGGNPEFATVYKVVKAMGLKMHIEP